MKKLLAVLSSVVVVLTLWVGVPSGPNAAADVDVYRSEGSLSYQGRTHVHHVNGRYWDTQCEPYSTTLRCRTYIWAKPIKRVGNTFQVVEGWEFNNLTYLPLARSAWQGNPLGEVPQHPNGEFESAGRLWRTECDSPQTGRDGCRSWIWGTRYHRVEGGFEQRNEWVFNNIVLFIPGDGPAPTPAPSPTPTPSPTATPSPSPTPTGPPPSSPVRDPRLCNAPLPNGYAYTSQGRPYRPENDLYSPATAFHPHAMNLYILNYNTSSATDAQKRCVMEAVGLQMIDASLTATHGGRTGRWLPYDFHFSANPSAPALRPGWYSGLSQGTAITAMRLVHSRTGDAKWASYAQELANSLDVPYSAGGVKNTVPYGGSQNQWLEEYPTGSLPTTVLNGNNLALIGLAMHRSSTGDPLAANLFTDGIAAYHRLLPLFEIPVSNNLMSTYDLVRGYPAAPLRLVSASGSLTRATLNGTAVTIPVERTAPAHPNVLVNGDFAEGDVGWRPVLNQGAIIGGRVVIYPNGAGHTGVQQIIPRGTFPAGSAVTMQFDTRMKKRSTGASTAPLVSVQGVCPDGVYTNLVRHSSARGENWGTYRASFNAPAEDCDIAVNLLQDVKNTSGGEVEFDNIVVRQADPRGRSLAPAYDYYVWRTPTQDLRIHGQGTFEVQVYVEGAWVQVGRVATTPSGVAVRIPEEFTGRNVNHRYHESHIGELRQLASHSGDRLFTTTANRWVRTAINQPN